MSNRNHLNKKKNVFNKSEGSAYKIAIIQFRIDSLTRDGHSLYIKLKKNIYACVLVQIVLLIS